MSAGIGSDRFARFNHDVKLTQHKAQLKLQGQSSDVAHFDHSLDFMTQLQVNSLCQQLGLSQPYPFLDPDKLCGSEQQSSGDGQQQEGPEQEGTEQEEPEQEEPEQDAADPVAEQPEDWVGPADWDEDVLSGELSEDGSDWDEGGAAAAAAAAEYAAARAAAACR